MTGHRHTVSWSVSACNRGPWEASSWATDLGAVFSLLCPQCLRQCLAPSRCSVSTEHLWEAEWEEHHLKLDRSGFESGVLVDVILDPPDNE